MMEYKDIKKGRAQGRDYDGEDRQEGAEGARSTGGPGARVEKWSG
jgi:hypothetical protein